jgi:hypothetical protein
MQTSPPQAVLVSLTFKFGRQGGQDDEMTNELCTKHNADKTLVKGTKRTICKEAFDPLKKIMGEFRGCVGRVTIPWDIKGVSFCKPVAVTKVIAARDQYGPLFNESKQTHLLDQYETWKTITKEKLGNAWKEEEFPTREDLTSNVFWKMGISPLSESDAFRKIKDIDENLMAVLIESNDARVNDGIRKGMVTAYNRLMEPMAHMVDVLTDDDSTKIHESLVDNVRKVIEEIPSLNLADDPILAQFARQAGEMLATLKTDDLRFNKNKEFKVVRRKVAQQATDMLATFGQVGIRKFAQ